MTRRASLPGAEELFRKTAEPRTVPLPPLSPSLQVTKQIPTYQKPRHEEKVTFYCTVEELTRLERARLELRAELRMSSDRGRIIRAALAEILDDFELRGEDSALVRRLEDL